MALRGGDYQKKCLTTRFWGTECELKRQAWVPYRSWSRITSGVLLSVIGAVQMALASSIRLSRILTRSGYVNISIK